MLIFVGLWAVLNLWCTSINNSAPIRGGNKDPIDCLFLPSGSLAPGPSHTGLPFFFFFVTFILLVRLFFFFHPLAIITVDGARPDLSQVTVAETQCGCCLCSRAVCDNNLTQRGTGWVAPGAVDNGSRVNMGMWIVGIYWWEMAALSLSSARTQTECKRACSVLVLHM